MSAQRYPKRCVWLPLAAYRGFLLDEEEEVSSAIMVCSALAGAGWLQQAVCVRDLTAKINLSQVSSSRSVLSSALRGAGTVACECSAAQGIDEAGQRYCFCLGGGCPTATSAVGWSWLAQAPRPRTMASRQPISRPRPAEAVPPVVARRSWGVLDAN
jgi:hypothetical protein